MADDLTYHGSFLWNDIRDIKADGNYLYCAFSEGVGVIDLRRDYTKKKIFSSVAVSGLPMRLFVSEYRLAVECENGVVWVIDKTDPGNLMILGKFTPQSDVWDIAFLGDYLYAAVEYEGIYRYDISDPDDIRFDDSSMYGIRVIDLEVRDSSLLALDNYNGLLVYQPNDNDLGNPIVQLLLPKPGVTLSVYNDTAYVGVQTLGFMVAALNDLYDAEYVETRSTIIHSRHIAPVQTGYAVANSIAGFEIYFEEGESLHSQLFPVLGIAGEAEFFEFEGLHYIVYPHRDKGLVAFMLDNPYEINTQNPDIILANAGPITQIAYINSRLHTIGTGNWYEMYSLDNPSDPTRTGVVINPPYSPAGLCSRGDTIFVADFQTKQIFPVIDTGGGNPVLRPPFFSIANVIARPYVETRFNGVDDLFYCFSGDYLLGTTRSPEGINKTAIAWTFDDNPLSVLFDDTVLYVGLFNSALCAFGITEEYQLYEINSVTVNGRVRSMILRDTLLYLGANGLITAAISEDYSLTEVATETETGTVYDIVRIDDRLYCATQNGVFVYDIANGQPQRLFFGGERSNMIAVDGNTIATSDGSAIKVYTIDITDVDDDIPMPIYDAPRITGYPNPFNPAITLVLEHLAGVGEPVSIEIYDILGRRITAMTTERGTGNRQTVVWDGTDEQGVRVASGIYFIRASANDRSAVLKAVLMK